MRCSSSARSSSSNAVRGELRYQIATAELHPLESVSRKASLCETFATFRSVSPSRSGMAKVSGVRREALVDGELDVAIELCMYCMKAQVFLDGNKRAAIIFANHYLVSHGGGLLVVPEADVPRFKELLIGHYEGNATEELRTFMKKRCWRRF